MDNFIKEYEEFLAHIQAYLKSPTFIPSLTDLNAKFMVDQNFSCASMYRFLNKPIVLVAIQPKENERKFKRDYEH